MGRPNTIWRNFISVWNQNEIITIMRNNLKPSGFRLWRARVQGRKTKHSKQGDDVNRFKCSRQRGISNNKVSKR